MKPAWVKRFPLFALVLLALGAGACSSYSYYDLDLKWGTGFDFTKISTIVDCHLLVSGAANDDITLQSAALTQQTKVCSTATAGDLGTVEYSTFADSGNITFTLTAFAFPAANPNCKLGEGSITLAAAKGVRMTGTVTATASPAPAMPCM
jgi:hypothetical protein